MLDKSMFKSPNLRLEHGLADGAGLPLVCPGCRREVSQEVFEQEFCQCARCGYTHKMSARQRIAMILDEGSFLELDAGLQSSDPLGFPSYREKLNQARTSSGEKEAVITGLGSIEGRRCAFFASEPGFMMGSMGAAVGEKLSRLFDRAAADRLSVVGFTISGGARVQEGIISLMQMAKVSGAVRRHSDAGLLYIAVLCDATTGGVAASFAMQADIILAEPGALIGFAGPRVIEQTTRQKLPEGFQRAEFQLEKGFVGKLCRRPEQKALLASLLAMHEVEPA
ncbi:MAG: acetyl-CoA carboxylase carboxyl transferase subunit beta [Clostridiales bacterium]|nr:acetyl-CoA carboxylase carboxyl transferase subunit beta [Clostridiales bacterium]